MLPEHKHKSSKISILIDRAYMFAKARHFFLEKEIVEVDCPILSTTASLDAHIELMQTESSSGKIAFLHSSPEYGMKKLLCEGIGDIYQISHVFRKNEQGSLHQPEFTMVEWYRIDFTFEQMISETLTFIRLFLGDIPATIMTYKQALQTYAGINYTKMTKDDLIAFMKDKKISFYDNIDTDGCLNLIFSSLVEEKLSNLTVITHYPASQSALAKVDILNGEAVALRFEIYFNTIELANGYHELQDPEEHLKRFIEINNKRSKPLPIDTSLIQALEKGLPNCFGVAVGFDRLMMIRHNKNHIKEVIPS